MTVQSAIETCSVGTSESGKKRSIAEVSSCGLCCSCGACAWACPAKAISYIETVGGHLLPTIDTAACTECGTCISVCPAGGLVSPLLNGLPHDPFIGTALQTYVGKSTDRDLYANSQSGGIVSALLANVLKTGEIEAAVTVVMGAGNPPRTMARIAKSVEDIRQAQKSKYCPVPLLSILKEIENLQGPVAFVGVACQIHGLCNILERYPHLKNKISLTIGLICDRMLTYGAVDFLLKKTGLPKKDGMILHFRDKTCGGYPGNVNVICSDGCSASVPASTRMRIKDFFTPACCRVCFDKMNVLADITVGDPWGIEGHDKIGGESVAIIRSEAGRRVFQSALRNSALVVREITYRDVLEGQKIEQKRSQWHGYAEAWKSLGRLVPNFWQQVSGYSGPRQQNESCINHLRHALALDQYPSRDALIVAAEKFMFSPKFKKQAYFDLPIRDKSISKGEKESLLRSRPMLIEIKGAGFVNKGAELMLHAVLQKVGGAFPEASFAVKPSKKDDYLRRAKLGLYQKVWFRKDQVQRQMFEQVIPEEMRRRYGLVLDEEIDVVLDASGFSYGDQWGQESALVMAACVTVWKQRGAKVVLLPQALGPFTSPNIRTSFAYIVGNADLVFPRDDISYQHIIELVGERENVCQAPDFTNLVSGIMPRDPEKFRGRFCLVPNYHMIKHTSDEEGDLYLSFCIRCINCLIKSQHDPFILIHGGQKDKQLAKRIVDDLGEEIEIIEETDALKTKGILGLCSGVISSRYHALVSALSQGVPALATGWSHKYEMLFKEYGFPDGCLPVSIESETLSRQIERIATGHLRKEIIARITEASAIQKEKTEMMWQKVFSVIAR